MSTILFPLVADEYKLRHRVRLTMDLGISKERLPILIIEMIAIVFSDLLALGVNEWRQSLKDQGLARSATDTILNEVVTNLTEIRRALAYHDSLKGDILAFRHTAEAFKEPRPAALRNLQEVVSREIRERFESRGFPASVSFAVHIKDSTRVDIYFSTGLRGYATFDDHNWSVHGPKPVHLKSGFIRNDAWDMTLATQAPPHMKTPVVAGASEIHCTQEQYNETVSLILRSLYQDTFLFAAFEDLISFELKLIDQYESFQELIP